MSLQDRIMEKVIDAATSHMFNINQGQPAQQQQQQPPPPQMYQAPMQYSTPHYGQPPRGQPGPRPHQVCYTSGKPPSQCDPNCMNAFCQRNRQGGYALPTQQNQLHQLMDLLLQQQQLLQQPLTAGISATTTSAPQIAAAPPTGPWTPQPPITNAGWVLQPPPQTAPPPMLQQAAPPQQQAARSRRTEARRCDRQAIHRRRQGHLIVVRACGACDMRGACVSRGLSLCTPASLASAGWAPPAEWPVRTLARSPPLPPPLPPDERQWPPNHGGWLEAWHVRRMRRRREGRSAFNTINTQIVGLSFTFSELWSHLGMSDTDFQPGVVLTRNQVVKELVLKIRLAMHTVVLKQMPNLFDLYAAGGHGHCVSAYVPFFDHVAEG